MVLLQHQHQSTKHADDKSKNGTQTVPELSSERERIKCFAWEEEGKKIIQRNEAHWQKRVDENDMKTGIKSREL